MLFNIRKVRAVYEVLRSLKSKEARYTRLFRETKTSHKTLQTILKELLNEGHIERQQKGKQQIIYEITNKGKKLQKLLENITKL